MAGQLPGVETISLMNTGGLVRENDTGKSKKRDNSFVKAECTGFYFQLIVLCQHQGIVGFETPG